MAFEKIQQLIKTSAQIILDKEDKIELACACLLARGHLLIEDIPGVGKTSLVKTLAQLLGLQFNRIQMTNDLLPADILGSSIYNQNSKQFEFHSGPIFTELLLVDELNRASPRTQSACLEAMEEKKVTVDGKTHLLPEPFFLIATQNPREQYGTYQLPESQLDRFLMCLDLGYPNAQAEAKIIQNHGLTAQISELKPLFTKSEIVGVQNAVDKVFCSEKSLAYLQKLIAQTRQSRTGLGLSTRAAQSWLHAARAIAYLDQRDHVLVEDIQKTAVPVMSHRILPHANYEKAKVLANEIVQEVAVI